MTVRRGDNGEQVVYICPKCRKHHYVSVGAFFMSPGDTAAIKKGFYGRQAKRNFERYPGKSAMFSYDVFKCLCGYARSKEVMVIFDDDQAPWSMDPERKVVWHNARCMCPRCGSNMMHAVIIRGGSDAVAGHGRIIVKRCVCLTDSNMYEPFYLIRFFYCIVRTIEIFEINHPAW